MAVMRPRAAPRLARPNRRARPAARASAAPVAGAGQQQRPAGALADALPVALRAKARAMDKCAAADDTKTGYHIHFGAGRLGLGLVLPALHESGVPFAILQRPSKQWASFAESVASEEAATASSEPPPEFDAVEVHINDEPIDDMGLALITDKHLEGAEFIDPQDALAKKKSSAAGKEQQTLSAVIETAADEEGERPLGHLVVTGDIDTWADLIANATSFSCALGSAATTWLGPLLEQLPERREGERPILYACENDHAAIAALAVTLRCRVDVVPCVVDRICAGLEVSGEEGAIKVTAEAHEGTIVMLEQPHEEAAVPLDGETVTVPETPEGARYLYRKKLVTVNGTHTALAFLTLCTGTPDGRIADLPLMSFATATEEQRDVVWHWAVAQLLMLVHEHGVDVMLEAHGVDTERELAEELVDHMRTTLDRFSQVEGDTTGRVLGGGVHNRFCTRLRPVQEAALAAAATSRSWGAGSAQRLILQLAGVGLADVVRACNSVVRDAWRFAAEDGAERGLDAPRVTFPETLVQDMAGDVMYRPRGEDGFAAKSR